MDEVKGRIFDIKRFAVHDGEGLRTTFFLKGCPLNCIWCHNPEGISDKIQISYVDTKCINCGECIEVCKSTAHYLQNGFHKLNFDRCIGCGECEKVCLTNTLKIYGYEMSVDELVTEALKDLKFYLASGGGVTFSGGECLLQADFVALCARKLKQYGIDIAVDTCGFVSPTCIKKVADCTDMFLYDFKFFDSELHKKYTGVENKIIKENLILLNDMKKCVEIRIPIIPGINDNEIENMANFLSGISVIKRIQLLKYNHLAKSKYLQINRKYKMPEINPYDDNKMEKIADVFRSVGIETIC